MARKQVKDAKLYVVHENGSYKQFGVEVVTKDGETYQVSRNPHNPSDSCWNHARAHGALAAFLRAGSIDTKFFTRVYK